MGLRSLFARVKEKTCASAEPLAFLTCHRLKMRVPVMVPPRGPVRVTVQERSLALQFLTLEAELP